MLPALVENFGARCTHAWRTSCANQLVSHVVLVAGALESAISAPETLFTK